MADDEAKNENENEANGSGGGASWMIVLLVLVLALAAGAGGAFFFLSSKAPAPVEMPVEAEEETLDPGAEFQQRLVSLEPFVVNIAGEAYPRFLKLKLELETDSPAAKQELDARRPQVRDATILLLASKRLPEVNEFEGRALLKDDLKARINTLLREGKVTSVMFTEFVVQ